MEKIISILISKGYSIKNVDYEKVSYGNEGREGGYLITIDNDWGNISENNYNKITDLEKEIFKDGDFCFPFIMGFNLKSMLPIVKKLPNLKS